MSRTGEEDVEVQSLRARTAQDRLELSGTVEELADKLDVKRQAGRATAALSSSVTGWLRSRRGTVIAAAAAATLLLVYLWRKRR